MQQKRFWFSVAAVWLVMFITDWTLHGMWLADLYAQSAQLWKPQAEAQQWMWLTWLGSFIFSWAFVWIYSKGISKDNPWQQAFRYAGAILLVAKVPALITQWVFTTYSNELLWKWAVIGVFQAFACSLVMTWVYKPAWTPAPQHSHK